MRKALRVGKFMVQALCFRACGLGFGLALNSQVFGRRVLHGLGTS